MWHDFIVNAKKLPKEAGGEKRKNVHSQKVLTFQALLWNRPKKNV